MLNQTQQRGFGKPTAALTLDHTADEIWGLTLVGATASWRGGENDVNDYRAPTASAYGYLGWYLGPLVPALGLSATAAAGHDRDKTTPMVSGLYSAAANVSLEWSSRLDRDPGRGLVPFQYDGYRQVDGVAHEPLGLGPVGGRAWGFPSRPSEDNTCANRRATRLGLLVAVAAAASAAGCGIREHNYHPLTGGGLPDPDPGVGRSEPAASSPGTGGGAGGSPAAARNTGRRGNKPGRLPRGRQRQQR